MMSKSLLLIAIILMIFSVGISQIKPRKVKQQVDTTPIVSSSLGEAEIEPILEDQARDLFFVSDKKGQGRNIGMQVKVYQMLESYDFSVVSPYKEFRSGDRIKFGIETNVDGYIYVIGQGTSGKSQLLYPVQQVNKGRNFIYRGEEVIVPGNEWFRFDNRRGVEEVKIVVSKNKLDLLKYLVPQTTEKEVARDVEAEVLAIVQGKNESRDFIVSKENVEEKVETASIETKDIICRPLYAVNRERGSYTVLTLKLRHR